MARVVTDVAGLDKEFDYLIPADRAANVSVGTEVRVPLGGRRVGGWVVGFDTHPPEGITLKPITKVRGRGPEPAVVELASWAAWRWASKRSSFLRSASAGHAVPTLPPLLAPAGGPAGHPARPPGRPPARPARTPMPLPAGPGLHVLRLAPATDPTPLVAEAAQLGPILVVVPSAARAAILAARLRRAGGDVAVMPDDWAMARAGRSRVVIGARSAAWAPCPGMAAAVVLDAHDEGLTAEGAPTWNALSVVVERGRPREIPVYAVSACPPLELLTAGRLHLPERGAEVAGWAVTEVVDRGADDPRLGLWSERLVHLVRQATGGSRVACILNRTSRIRILSCSACAELARCEICDAAVTSPSPGLLTCPRCGHERPGVCARCGSTRLAARRVGVGRAREELEALTGSTVGEVTVSSPDVPATAVVIGTEALLHRLDPSSGVSAVAFVDLDQELLAPRIRAAEEAMALLAHASRLVRGRNGKVLLQTRVPDHPVVEAARHADPGLALAGQEELRRQMGLPPYASIALIHGDAAPRWVASLTGVEVLGPDPSGRFMVKAADHIRLCDALARNPRPVTGRLRVAVEPARI